MTRGETAFAIIAPPFALLLGVILGAGLSTYVHGPQGPMGPQWHALGEWRISAYCPGPCCCGRSADPSTALRAGGRFADGSSTRGQDMKVVAAPPEIPFGTRLWIEGVGEVVVRDRGRAITGRRLDLFCASHRAAREWGVRNRQVKRLIEEP